MAPESEQTSFDIIFRANYARAVALAAHVCGDRAGAEGLVQDVFWQLHETQCSETIVNPAAWVTTAITRRCLNERRRINRERNAIDRLPKLAPALDNFSFLHRAELAAALQT